MKPILCVELKSMIHDMLPVCLCQQAIPVIPDYGLLYHSGATLTCDTDVPVYIHSLDCIAAFVFLLMVLACNAL